MEFDFESPTISEVPELELVQLTNGEYELYQTINNQLQEEVDNARD